MKIAIYPGTFDPLTLGHLDLIQRAAKLVDKLIISVARNLEKEPLFSIDERIVMIKHALEDANVPINCEVVGFSGLLIDHAVEMNASVIIRGLRAVSDYDYEFQIASANQRLAPDIEVILLMARDRYHFLSSSLVKSVAKYKGNIQDFVPSHIAEKIQQRFS